MKKTAFLKNALLAGVLFAVASCGNEAPVEPIIAPTISNPNTIVHSLDISRITTNGYTYDFIYGSDGKLEMVNETYSYTDEWGASESLFEFDLLYTGGKLSSIATVATYNYTPVNGEPSVYKNIRTISYKYNDADLVTTVQVNYIYDFDGEQEAGSYTNTREYDAESRLVKEERVEDGVLIWQDIFSWSGRNVTRQQFYEVSSAGGRKQAPRLERKKTGLLGRLITKGSELTEEMVFSDFDDKVNPLVILSLLEEESFGGEISANNPGKFQYYEERNGTLELEQEVTIAHIYDSKGRPTNFVASYTKNDNGDLEDDELIVSYRD